jgi:hypothetical protein
MIDPKHLFTVHNSYTGKGCALCGLAPVDHDLLDWMINGERITDPLEMNSRPFMTKAGRQ